ncbi:MAG: MFS transporter [Candidatus Thermoplasmatota archaeon]
MEQSAVQPTVSTNRSRKYLIYLVVFMALVALMDQYLSFIETTAIPYVLQEYQVTDSEYSWWKTIYFLPTLLIFLLNGLNDLIGRKKSILILILILGVSALGMVYATPSFHLFMVFLAFITFAAVSNMWTIPISEEAPKEQRAKLASIVYFISMIPIQAVIPPLLMRLGLHWKWMYGFMFIYMLPVLIMWLFMKETKRFELIKEQRKQGLPQKAGFGFHQLTRRDLKYIVFSSVIWMCGLIVSMLLVWSGHFFRDIHGFSLDEWSLVLFGGLTMMMIGGLLGGWLMDKIGRKQGLLIGSVGLSICMGFIGIIPLFVAILFMMGAGFCIGFSYVWIIVYIPEIFPTQRRGICMGWTTALARISYIIGPALAAILLSISPGMELFWGCCRFNITDSCCSGCVLSSL